MVTMGVINFIEKYFYDNLKNVALDCLLKQEGE